VPWAPSDTFQRAERHLGKGYDYWGLLMTQLVNTYMAAQELAETRQAALRPRATHGAPFFPGSGIFAGGLRSARDGAAHALSHMTAGIGDDGVRATAPQRVAKRTQGLPTTRTRPALAQPGNVIRFPGRIAR